MLSYASRSRGWPRALDSAEVNAGTAKGPPSACQAAVAHLGSIGSDVGRRAPHAPDVPTFDLNHRWRWLLEHVLVPALAGVTAVLRGGMNAGAGQQSVLEVPAILALRGSSRLNRFDITPCYSRGTLGLTGPHPTTGTRALRLLGSGQLHRAAVLERTFHGLGVDRLELRRLVQAPLEHLLALDRKAQLRGGLPLHNHRNVPIVAGINRDVVDGRRQPQFPLLA